MKELERRGHTFCRYADDANVDVGSKRAGERVMRTLERFVTEQLRLRVNRDKSAVGRPWKRKFLGYSMTVERTPRLKVAPESESRLRQKLKAEFRRARGRNLSAQMHELRPLLTGWSNYYKHAEDQVDPGRARRGSGQAVSLQRTRTVVERRSVAHERGAAEALLCRAWTGEPSLTASPLADGFVNRRIRNRTYGGVGGRRG